MQSRSNQKPLRILPVVPRTTGAPCADARQVDESLRAIFASLAGKLELLEVISDATEANLRRRLSDQAPDVVYYVGQGKGQRTANYATISLTSSEGSARSTNLRHAAGLLSAQPSVRLVVLQSCPPGPHALEGFAAALVGYGAPAAIEIGALAMREQAIVLATLCEALASGSTLDAAAQRGRDRLAMISQGGAFALAAGDKNARLITSASAEVDSSLPAPQAPPAVSSPTAPSPQDEVQRRLAEKRAAGEFDVFLCHNWADKPAVKQIGLGLRAHGILSWLDEWELPPGQPWQPLLEKQITRIRSAAVFVSGAGLGPWQQREVDAFLRSFRDRSAPVIPVLLGNAPPAPDLPVFLAGMTWVDFRVVDPDPLLRLAWGITGVKPDGA